MSSAGPSRGERPRKQYCFGAFLLDAEAGVLRRDEKEIRLRPKPFEVLAYLVEHHGRLVSKTELLQAIWPDTAVTDNSLVQCLREIRRELGDDSQQLIRTVARRGYVFAAPVGAPIVAFPPEPPVEPMEPRPVLATPVPSPRATQRYVVSAGALVVAAAIGGLTLFRAPRPVKQKLTYTQLTNFTDSAVTAALSPDGRMLAFIRGQNWWQTSGKIYVKLLPNGDPVQISDDSRPKYGLAFSPDGSRIAYTVNVAGNWITYTVSPFGGEPVKLLSNAAGLTWLDEHHLLFSEIKTGLHMGVVTARENRSEYRQIYFPRDERGMVHLSYASPDRKWALAVEMDPVWLPCRVIPLDGSSEGQQAGPAGKCTSAAWSPNGKWMYLGVEVDGQHHLWRQRFPTGKPEQITFGPTEEDGVAVSPDGRSLITSIGMRQVEVWIHDARGERRISSEGQPPTAEESGRFAAAPTFSGDGKSLYYLRRTSPGAATELWRADLDSEKNEKVVPGFSILEYDISNDGREAVFSAQTSAQASQIWLASLDQGARPELISASGGDSPHFGPGREILFRLAEGNTHYLARINRDGSGRSKAVPYPIGNVEYISPDRRWMTTISPLPYGGRATLAVPTAGGAPRIICPEGTPARWAPNGKFFYVSVRGKTAVIPVPAGETLPKLPPSGIRSVDDASSLPGSQVIDAFRISPGPNPSVFAYLKGDCAPKSV